MNKAELRRAFSAIYLAIHFPRDKKPKSLLHATSGYRQGSRAKPRHIKELGQMTLEEIFDLCYTF